MLTLTVTANTAAELQAKVMALFMDRVPAGTTLTHTPDAPATPTTPAVNGETIESPKRGRGRPPKEKAPEVDANSTAPAPAPTTEATAAAAAPVEAPAAPATVVDPFAPEPAATVQVEAAKPLTADDATAALKKVMEKHGLTGCREVLAVHGTDRISLVKPEDYARFIKTCQEWVEKPAKAAA